MSLGITSVAFCMGLSVPDLEAILGSETPSNSFQLNPSRIGSLQEPGTMATHGFFILDIGETPLLDSFMGANS